MGHFSRFLVILVNKVKYIIKCKIAIAARFFRKFLPSRQLAAIAEKKAASSGRASKFISLAMILFFADTSIFEE